MQWYFLLKQIWCHKYDATNSFPSNIQLPCPSREVKWSLSMWANCYTAWLGGHLLRSLGAKLNQSTRSAFRQLAFGQDTLALSHQQQITGLENRVDTYQSVVLSDHGDRHYWTMSNICLFVYLLRILILCPFCGFQHRKDNLKQQNKQRKPTASEKKNPVLVTKDSSCNTLCSS